MRRRTFKPAGSLPPPRKKRVRYWHPDFAQEVAKYIASNPRSAPCSPKRTAVSSAKGHAGVDSTLRLVERACQVLAIG
jgi:hypothetical protein